jgi:hypothetical protein
MLKAYCTGHKDKTIVVSCQQPHVVVNNRYNYIKLHSKVTDGESCANIQVSKNTVERSLRFFNDILDED